MVTQGTFAASFQECETYQYKHQRSLYIRIETENTCAACNSKFKCVHSTRGYMHTHATTLGAFKIQTYLRLSARTCKHAVSTQCDTYFCFHKCKSAIPSAKVMGRSRWGNTRNETPHCVCSWLFFRTHRRCEVPARPTPFPQWTRAICCSTVAMWCNRKHTRVCISAYCCNLVAKNLSQIGSTNL